MPGRSGQLFPGPLDGLGSRFQIDNIAVGNNILRQYLDRVSLHTIAILAITGEFNHLDGRRADVNAYQCACLGTKDRKIELQIASLAEKTLE
jgi:hypothetical protein